MTTTKYLQLPIPSKSDRGKIITECLDPAFTKIDQKIETVDENIDFNLLATLGIPYGGELNNNNQKVAGTAYYDTANKKIYKCTGNTSINYADAAYFIEVSNNDLLGKLQNLIQIKPRNYLVGNICFEYFTFSGGAGLYTKSLVNNFKEIIFVGFNGLTNEDQVNPEFSQHWLVYSYNEIASKKAIKLRKMSTQSIEGIIIGIL